MKHTFLKASLSASLLLSSAGAILQPSAVFAQEESFTEFAQDENTSVSNEIAAEEFSEETILENTEAGTYRNGTDVSCNLTLNTKVNGEIADHTTFVPGQEEVEVQLGGTLDLSKVWSSYDAFKLAYTLTHSTAEFRSKALKGSYTYTFTINPDVVTVNEDILCNPAEWQKAFEEGSGDKASAFFSFMRCSAASYDETTGEVSVTFTINENSTNKVSVGTIEDNKKTAKPKTIEAYSPKGGMVIKSENFTNGAVAVPRPAKFCGEIDMDPWMAMVFPIRFNAETVLEQLTLNVPDTSVSFNVENGTWADGTNETKSIVLPTKVVNIDGTWQAAGTLSEDLIPSGMIASEGFDKKTGKWTPALNMDENGIIMNADGTDGASYTYSFDKKVVEDEEEELKTTTIYRVYNPNSGEHFYTGDLRERDYLISLGWNDENIGWVSPEKSDYPVYRVYNPNAGDHHYTMNEEERDVLVSLGWKDEGIAWYSMPHGQGVEVLRQYNPNAKAAGAHNFTTDRKENNHLISLGWSGEGVGWWVIE